LKSATSPRNSRTSVATVATVAFFVAIEATILASSVPRRIPGFLMSCAANVADIATVGRWAIWQKMSAASERLRPAQESEETPAGEEHRDTEGEEPRIGAR
jgi:hypothetical protein